MVEIEINGKQEQLRYNNYSDDVLKKFFMKEGELFLSPKEFMERIVERFKESETLLIKNLVYAGVVGASFIQSDTPKYSKAEIGEYIANAKPEEKNAVWQAFLEHSGINLSKEEEETEESQEEADPEDEKKNMKSS